MKIIDMRNTDLSEQKIASVPPVNVKARALPTMGVNKGVVKTTTSELTPDDMAMIDEALGSENVKELKVEKDGSLKEKLETAVKEGSVVADGSEEAEEMIDGEHSKQDAIVLAKIIDRVKAGQKFSIYNAMTPSLKKTAREQAHKVGIYNLQGIQMFAHTMIAQMIQDKEIDKAWDKLQGDIKDASRMPAQTDMYGFAVYENMCFKSLIKAHAFEYKDAKHDADLYRSVAKTYIECMYFKPILQAAKDNFKAISKCEKLYKRYIDDIDFKFPKLAVNVTKNTSCATNAPLIMKNFDEHSGAALICAIGELIAKLDPEKLLDKEIAFVMSQFIGIYPYLDKDPEKRTEYGQILYDSFMRFGNTLLGDFDEALKEADAEIDEHYKKLDEKAKEQFLTDYLPKMKEKLDKVEDQEDGEVPNATTVAAINDLETGKDVKQCKNADEMLADCGVDVDDSADAEKE